MSINTLKNDSISKHLNLEKVRYHRKGYGIFFAVIQAISFFVLFPIIATHFYPKKIENVGSFFFFTVLIYHEAIFIIINLIFLLIYYLELEVFERYKIQDRPWPWKENKKEWNKLLKHSFFILAINQFIMLPLSTIPSYIYDFAPYEIDPDKIPTLSVHLIHLVFYMVCEDFFFYWSHRFLHWDKIYNYFHKIHHKYTHTISIASEYAHPVEFFLSNILPTSSGPLILGLRGHFITYLMWITFSIFESTDGHCGYEFSWSPYRLLPFSGSSEYHNYHHINYKGNYCSLFTFWDKICGTVSHNYIKSTNKKYESEKNSKIKTN